MVLNYYNLREQPFGVTADPGCLYLSPTHREALASLAYGIQSGRGFMSLLAKPGMGKTTILFRLLDQLKNSARTVYLFQTLCRPEDLLRGLVHDLGVDDDSGDVVSMQAQLNNVLLAEARVGRKIIVVIDEAQNLENSSLELVRMLSNFETTSDKLMQIILAGQPQLREKLASPQLLQLRQRMSIIARLQQFDAEETRLYIAHRLRVAGYDFKGPLFTQEAEALIATRSEGIPRNINNICFNALSLGWVLKQRTIEKEVVLEAIQDLSLDDEVLARQDHEPEPTLVSGKPRQPRGALREHLAWGKRIAASAILLPLLSFSSGRGPELRQHLTRSNTVSTPMAATQAAAVAPGDTTKQLSAAVSGAPLVAAQSQARPAVVERVSQTDALQHVRQAGGIGKFGEPRIISTASLPIAEKPSPNKRRRPTTPDELWAQVKKDDSDAEVELARIYREGTSVPRNCTQAQILLEAASRHGSALAIDLLNDRKNECH